MAKKHESNEKLDNIRHSLAHILAIAVLEKFPNAKLGIGPTVENGFYYDFDLPRPLKDEELKELEQTMRGLIGKKLPFEEKKVTATEARTVFQNQPFKRELIDEYEKEKRSLTTYTTGSFVDLCRGGHVANTSDIAPDAFQLTKTAGAYWKGNEQNKMLTRIYGVAFQTKKELKKHIQMLEGAEKRDHRKLGRELDLFLFSELVGGGLPLWTPKGTIVRDLLDDCIWKLRMEAGYKRVDIPHITKKELYEKSGHWEKFQDELFRIISREGHEFVLKPMNCPHHIQIFSRRTYSYRDLPVRYASTTKVYRDEQTGELAGLTRVRSITQDDAHVFCRASQIQEEILAIWNIVEKFYKKFDFSLAVRLSLHDPRHTEKYLGTKEMWENTESQLRTIAKKQKARTEEAVGEAAHYGPKIDFLTHDSLGREWQVATIQLDLTQPERFDLFCVNENGQKERIVIIHAAVMGSIERFLAVLIEHYAGSFPFWLAPVQVQVLPVNDKNKKYIASVSKILTEHDIRHEIDTRNESIGKKIREAELQKIPYLLIIGDKEAASKTVAVRERGKGDVGQKSLQQLLKKL